MQTITLNYTLSNEQITLFAISKGYMATISVEENNTFVLKDNTQTPAEYLASYYNNIIQKDILDLLVFKEKQAIEEANLEALKQKEIYFKQAIDMGTSVNITNNEI